MKQKGTKTPPLVLIGLILSLSLFVIIGMLSIDVFLDVTYSGLDPIIYLGYFYLIPFVVIVAVINIFGTKNKDKTIKRIAIFSIILSVATIPFWFSAQILGSAITYQIEESKFNKKMKEMSKEADKKVVFDSTKSFDWKNYKNNKYEFELTFSKIWKDKEYRIAEDVDNGNIVVRVEIPDQSGEDYGCSEEVKFYILTTAQWKKIAKGNKYIDGNIKATYLAKNSNYYFGYQNSSIKDPIDYISYEDSENLIKTFKLTNSK